MKKEIVSYFDGVQIRTDKQGRVSLTDLWEATGKKVSQAPKFWLKQDGAVMFIETLEAGLKVSQDNLLKTSRGKGGGTYAHKQIALAYAKYLSPKLHLAVNQVFFERLEEEKNPDLILDRAVATYKKHGKTDNWISERLTGKATRLAFTNTLKKHGVTGLGFRNCTNAIYIQIFGGKAEDVRLKKNLPEKVNTREHMSEVELAQTRLVELLSKQNIEHFNIRGNKACELECTRTSRLVAESVTKALQAA